MYSDINIEQAAPER